MTDHSDLIAELRELITDWDGADIPDSSLPRIDVLCGTIRRAIDEIERLRRALKPFADFGQWTDAEGWNCNIHREGISVWFGPSDFRRARKALENGPAVLADATNDPADLSSLRKGAEVAVKPLEWMSHAWGCEADDGRYRIEDNGTNWTDDRYWLFVNVGLLTNHRSKYASIEAAKSAAQSDFETRIRSALVSGSREDGR